MKFYIHSTLMTGLCLVFAGGAMAASHARQQNFYGDLLVGYGKVNIIGAGENTGLAGNIDVGYRINRNIGLEVGYNQFNQIGNENSYSFDAAVKGIIPLDNSCMELYGKIGVAAVHARGAYSVNDSPALFSAVGMSYRLNNNVSLTGQFTATSRNEDQVPAMYGLTGGLSFNF